MDHGDVISELKRITRLQLLLNPKLDSGELDFRSSGEGLLRWTDEIGPPFRLAELIKCDARAAKFRNAGNRLYLGRKFNEALMWYNESICFAEPDSDQLGMGYANRSAVCFEQRQYEFALYNIELAMKHNYPEKLMEKLLAREVNCKQQIAARQSKGAVFLPRMNINVDTNPRIPFLADGIKMGYDPKKGRGLFAGKDFNPGDVILDEKIEFCGMDSDIFYRICSQCSSTFTVSLIPCPTCTFFMYCSQECLELNWKLYHRFECGVATKLCSVSSIWGMTLTRFFFYGLSQFDDDLQSMMEYCKPDVNAEPNPLDLDFTNLNRLEVFKVMHNTKPLLSGKQQAEVKLRVKTYYLVFLMNPAVSTIICTKARRRFFYFSLLKYIAVVGTFMDTGGAVYDGHAIATIRPISSVFNHSCDPHAGTVIDAGRVKLFVLRPVRKGEQIFLSFGIPWWKDNFTLKPLCQCVVCDKGIAGKEWHELKERKFPQSSVKNVQMLERVLNSDTNNANKMNCLQQFIKRYNYLHPQKNLGEMLDIFNDILIGSIYFENLTMVRAKL